MSTVMELAMPTVGVLLSIVAIQLSCQTRDLRRRLDRLEASRVTRSEERSS